MDSQGGQKHMNNSRLFRTRLPLLAWLGIAVLWLALSAAVAWAVGLPYGLFMAWAGIAIVTFAMNPLAGMLGLLVLGVVAAEWGQSFVLFPGKSYNINQAGLANLVMLGSSLLYVLKRRPKLGPLALPFLAFLAAGLISIPFSASPFAGLRDWSRIAPLAGIYIVTSDLVRGSPRRAHLWIWVVVVSSVGPAIVAVYQFFTNTGYHNAPEVNRLLGTLGHPITYGVYLGVIVALLLIVIREADSALVRVVLALGGMLSMVLLYATYSRGPALAMTGSLLVLAVAARRETWMFRGSVAVLAALFLLFNIYAGRIEDLQQTETYVNLTPQAQATPVPQRTPSQRVTPIPLDNPDQAADTFLELLADGSYREAHEMLDANTASRITAEQLAGYWSQFTLQSGPISECETTGAEKWPTYQVVDSRCNGDKAPLEIRVVITGTGGIIALGAGRGTYSAANPHGTPAPAMVYGVNSLSWRLNLWRYALDLAAHRPVIGIGLGSFPTYSPKLVGSPVTPHNDFVRVFAEMGIVGLIPYLWLCGTLLWALYRLWRWAPDRSQSLFAAGLIAVAACYFVNSLSADLLNYPILGWVFWSLMALPEAFRQKPETAA
jgi:hypothetical protein